MMRTLVVTLALVFTLAVAADEPHEPAHAHGHGHGQGDALPLHDIMHGLGAQVLALTYALLHGNMAGVAHHAGLLADHPAIAEDDLERIARLLGDEMAEFERLDGAVHHAAERLHQAAQAGDNEGALTHLDATLRGCVACHSQFRDRVETESGEDNHDH